MGAETFTQRPDRMTLANLETGATITAQFNPDEVKESLAVNFNELAILGMSHKPLQYLNTDNLELSFDLAFDGISMRDVTTSGGSPPAMSSTVDMILYARRFLHHLCYPSNTAQDVSGGGPPRCFVNWPNLYSLTCRLTKVTITHKRWAQTMSPVLFTASVTFKEARDVRLFAEDVIERGTGETGTGRG